MLLSVETVAAEEVDVSMEEVVAEDVEEEGDEVYVDTSKEVVEGAASHMKTELTYQMPPVTLKIQIGPHSQTIQGKVSVRTQYAQSYCQIKRYAPPSLSALKRTKRTG